MSGLVESATAILSASERRLEIAASNVANVATPGFKRQVGFMQMLEAGRRELPEVSVRRAWDQGTLASSGNPLDLAISGSGFFQLRDGTRMIYSRQGQFSRAVDGSVVTPQGYVLQQAGGGDLVLDGDDPKVTSDGTILAKGAPVARLAVYASADPAAMQPVGESFFAVPGDTVEAVSDPVVRQGMVENSNVSTGDEMVTMMAALRQSEAGARLVQVYDDLLGRAITSLGANGR